MSNKAQRYQRVAPRPADLRAMVNARELSTGHRYQVRNINRMGV